jgi:hypothetical protein
MADDFMSRLMTERREPNECLKKLDPFILTGTFEKLDEVDRTLLAKQSSVMADYDDVLLKRYVAHPNCRCWLK